MVNVEKLYYGIMNYRDETGELRIHTSTFSNNISFAAWALNEKRKNPNIEVISHQFQSFYREFDYFEKLAYQNLFINKKDLDPSNENENFDDDDEVVLVTVCHDFKEGVEKKTQLDFKTDDEFFKYLNKNATLTILPLDRDMLINHISEIKPVSLQAIPIINSLQYEQQIENFEDTEDYDFFEKEIEQCLENEEKYKADMLFFGEIYDEGETLMTDLTDDPSHAALLTEELMKQNQLEDADFSIDYIPFYNYAFEEAKRMGLTYKKGDYLSYDDDSPVSGEFVDNDEDCLILVKTITKEELIEQNPEAPIEAFDHIKDGQILHEIEQFIPSEQENYSGDYEIIACHREYSEDFEYEIMMFESKPEFDKYKNMISIIFEELEELYMTNIEDHDETDDEFGEEVEIISDTLVKQRLHGTWNNQIDLLKQLSEREDIKITLCHLDSGVLGVFNNDNMEYMFNFINDAITESEMYYKMEEFSISVVVRHFTDKKAKSGGKIQNISTCLLNNFGIFPFSKKDTMDVCLTCHETGKKLKKEKNVTYMSFQRLLDGIDLVLESEPEEKRVLH